MAINSACWVTVHRTAAFILKAGLLGGFLFAAIRAAGIMLITEKAVATVSYDKWQPLLV